MRKLFLCISAGLMSLALVTPSAVRAQALVTSEPQLAIPDDGGSPVCMDTITFTQAGDTIGAFRVGLAIGHSYQAQLRVLLLPPGVVWPSATYSATDIPSAVAAGAIELVANAGGSSADIGGGFMQPYDYASFTTAGDPVFDPAYAATSISSAPSATGMFGTWLAHDEVALGSVYGGDPADYDGQGGAWTLVVIDDTATEDGTLVAWQLEYDVIAVDPPEILVLRGGPIPHNGTDDLGVLTVGVVETVTYNIGNTGLGPLHLTGVSTAAATNCTVTAVTPLPFTVSASDASPLELEVTPLSEGPFAFDLLLDNDDADENPYRIHVTGTAELAPFAVLHVTGNTLFVSPAVGTPVSEDWVVENQGSQELVIEAVALEGQDASDFALGGVPALPLSVAPGASASLSVIYLALSTDDASAAVSFVSNTNGTPGTVLRHIISGTIAPDATSTPELVVVGQTSFRALDVGSFDSAMWSLGNSGDADLIITSVDTIGSHAGAFAVSGLSLPATIPPGGTANLQVLFAPTAARAHAAVIRFTSNHGATPGTTTEVSVTGFITGTVEDPGCQCRDAGAGGAGSGLAFGLLVLGLLGWRRRRRARDVR